ncbi:MAG: type II toxin-antitoxin system PemK/MazF family toxin [Gallionella sp.]
MTRRFVPDAGDIAWLEFSPQAGHEQAGHRPALALSPAPPPTTAKPAPCCAAR